MKPLFRSFLFLAFLCPVLARSQKTVYLPDEWRNTSNVPYSMTRSMESDNFVVFWGPLVGDDPLNSLDPSLSFNPRTVLDTMENIYKSYIKDMKVLEERDNLAKYKMIVVINNTWRSDLYTGWAYGSGWDNVIGGMWVDPASFKDNGWTVSHEFTHAMQYMVPLLYPGHGFTDVSHAGFFWETHANFMAIQRYPTFITSTDMPRMMNMTSYYIGSPRKHYAEWYFLQLLKDKYGLDFVSRIWRESNQTAKEHPLETIRRLLGLSQAGMNDLMMEHALKGVKWDYSNKTEMVAGEASLGREYTWRRTNLLDSLSKGHYVIPDQQAPQQYGYNLVRLYPEAKAGCSQLYVHMKFKGHKDDNASSGWRYAFVTADETGATTYSDVHTDADGEVSYKFPSGAKEYYLVVMGAPTTYHVHTDVFEVGFPRLFRYPWEVELDGVVPEGYQAGFRSVDGVAGAAHSNGGGFVASTASVDATAYVGPHAFVMDRARVTGTARVEGKAVLRDDVSVSDQAVVSGFAIVGGDAQVSGKAKISEQAIVYYGTKVSGSAVVKGSSIMFYNNITDNAVIGGNAFSWGADDKGGTYEEGGDAEIGGTCTSGKYLQMPGLSVSPGAVTRPQCDGLITHPLNVDTNKVYVAYTATEMAFDKVVDCGDITGDVDNSLNKPPVVNAGEDKVITLPVSTVQLTGTASDPEGSDVVLRWTKLTGPTIYGLVGSGTTTVTAQNLVEGVYQFVLTGTDDLGAYGEDTVQVTVNKASGNGNGPAVNTDVSLTLVPNPANTSVTLSYPLGGSGELVISDVLGRKMKVESLPSINNAVISVASLASGVYFVQVRTLDGTNCKVKLVVQH